MQATKYSPKRIATAIQNSAWDIADNNNYGMLRCGARHASREDAEILWQLQRREERLVKDRDVWSLDGKPLCRVVHRYASRKVNLMYKELKPAIEML